MRDATTDFNAIFGVRKKRRDIYAVRKAVAVADMTDEDVGEINAAIPAGSSHVDGLADLIVEANPGVDRASALNFLLHTRNGAALIARTQRTTKKETPTVPYNRLDELRDIVAKGGGVTTLAKMIIDNPATGSKVSESEFTALVTDEARKAFPTLKADRAFAKYFEENLTVRKAHQVITSQPANQQSYLAGEPLEKAAPYATLEPRVSGGADAQDVANATDAMAKLNDLVAELRRAAPELTSAQAFARVYQDPNHHALAEAERRQNRPRVA
jgi:hypothetical protein